MTTVSAFAGLVFAILAADRLHAAGEPTAQNSFTVNLSPPAAPAGLFVDSPFGINTAFNPDSPELEARLKAMQQAGIKWGRQDFTWKRIEKQKSAYDFEPYDRLVEKCRHYGLLLVGNLTHNPDFHDMRTPEGVQAYCAFARATVKRYAGTVDYWQIWNEPNLGYLGGDPDHYAQLLGAAGKAIHETNPAGKVLGLNMAFCDALWTEQILRRVPLDCFDVICFYRRSTPTTPTPS